ncbi:hypothetical protein BWR19_15860 [Halomonas sp. 1513]|nr:hypothetical protein BWR19_15860 [Halomonas sp. 1513]
MANSGKKRRIKDRKARTKQDLAQRRPERKSTNRETPWFCFNQLQRGHCIQDCEREQQAAVADTLRRLSQLTWGEISQAHRHGLGYEKISRDSLKVPIPPQVTEDAQLLSFRCHAHAPMVGYRVDRVFHVVWVDRAFDVYNHGS